MFNLWKAAPLFSLLLLGLGNLFAEPLSFESSAGQKTNLVEIYSSEGCSSCPPAHRWISGFKNDPGLWGNFVPAVFHVDYWDQLGWKDKFDSPEYTERQRKYFIWWGESTLFTPCVILNGRLLEHWDSVKNFPAVSESPGVLKLDVLGSGWYQLSFNPAENSKKKMVGRLILLGIGIESRIERGENTGKVLTHDFTVLDYKREVLNDEDFSAEFELKIPENLLKKIQPEKLAVAGWVTEGIDPTPVQAVGGYLDE